MSHGRDEINNIRKFERKQNMLNGKTYGSILLLIYESENSRVSRLTNEINNQQVLNRSSIFLQSRILNTPTFSSQLNEIQESAQISVQTGVSNNKFKKSTDCSRADKKAELINSTNISIISSLSEIEQEKKKNWK